MRVAEGRAGPRVSGVKASLLLLASFLAGPLIAKPLQVYILVGQSNMEGHAKVKTIPYISEDPATKALHARLVGPDGKPRAAERVWISYLTGIGDTNGGGR